MLRADVDTPGNAISARKMTKLDESGRDAYRGRLICPDYECYAPAYFVSPKPNAKHGHFASRYHTDECELRSTDLVDIDEGQLRKERALFATSDVLKIRFDRPMVWKHGRQAKDPKKTNKKVGKTHTGGGNATTTSGKASMGLKRLLAHLVRGGGLGEPSPRIQLSDGTRGYANTVVKYTVDLGDAIPSGRLLFYGRIVSENVKSDMIWLNSGGFGSGRASVRMRGSVEADLLAREGVASVGDLVGQWFICEARASSRMQPGANLLVRDLSHIAFLKA